MSTHTTTTEVFAFDKLSFAGQQRVLADQAKYLESNIYISDDPEAFNMIDADAIKQTLNPEARYSPKGIFVCLTTDPNYNT